MLNEAKESVLLSFLFLALRQPKPENRKQDFSPQNPNYIKRYLPVEGGSHREPLANDLLRERIAQIGEQIELHKRNSISTLI